MNKLAAKPISFLNDLGYTNVIYCINLNSLNCEFNFLQESFSQE